MLAIGTLLLASGLASASVGVASPRALPASTYDEAACDAVIEAALSDEPDAALVAGDLEIECAPLVARALDAATVCSLLGELPRACEAPARRLLLLRRPDTLRANRAHDAALRASADGPRCLPDAAPPTVRDPSAPMLVSVVPRLDRADVAVPIPPLPTTVPRDPPHDRLERPPRA
jgi:hypothetical protein